MSGLLDQPVLVLKEKISYAQFRITDEVGAELGLVRGSLRDYGEDFDLEDIGGTKLASFRWGGEGVKGLQVFRADESHVGTVAVKRGDVTIFDGAEAELVRFDGSFRQQAQLSDATGAPIGTVRKVGAGIWRSLNGENDYRIDFVGEPSEDLRLPIIAGSLQRLTV